MIEGLFYLITETIEYRMVIGEFMMMEGYPIWPIYNKALCCELEDKGIDPPLYKLMDGISDEFIERDIAYQFELTRRGHYKNGRRNRIYNTKAAIINRAYGRLNC